MSESVPGAKRSKPKGGKESPLTATQTDVPVKVGQVDIPSSMGRTRSGIHRSTETWGDRVFGSGDRKHKNAKPSQ